MKSLAGCAVAVLGSQRFLAVKLIPDFPAVAAAFPFHVEALVIIVDSVGLPMLPLIFFTVCGVSSLVLVTIVSNDSICVSPIGLVGLILLLGRHIAEWAQGRIWYCGKELRFVAERSRCEGVQRALDKQ